MRITDERIDEIAQAWNLYSIQDNGRISRYDFKCCVREIIQLQMEAMFEVMTDAVKF